MREAARIAGAELNRLAMDSTSRGLALPRPEAQNPSGKIATRLDLVKKSSR